MGLPSDIIIIRSPQGVLILTIGMIGFCAPLGARRNNAGNFSPPSKRVRQGGFFRVLQNSSRAFEGTSTGTPLLRRLHYRTRMVSLRVTLSYIYYIYSPLKEPLKDTRKETPKKSPERNRGFDRGPGPEAAARRRPAPAKGPR